MQALRYTPWSWRLPFAVVAGALDVPAWAGGAGSPLRLVDVAPPPLPDRGWVRLRVDLAGICGTDLKLLRGTAMSPAVTAFSDWRQPMILGHEIVGTVLEAPADGVVEEGARVVAEPILTCRDRGLDECAACAAGQEQRCLAAGDRGALPAGHGFGFNARFGGGWAEQVVVPARRCLPVPDSLSDPDAVLAEPLAIAVHAVRESPQPAERALVIGPGTVGLCSVMALHALAGDTEVSVAGLTTFADDWCRRLGADHVVHGTRAELVAAAADVTGGTLRRTAVGPPVVDGGYDVVFDCVGSVQTIDDALRVLRPGGELVLIATSARQRVDWTLVWLRELTVRGAIYYATSPEGRRDLAAAVDILSDVRPGRMVTHAFALQESVAALTTAAAGPGAGAIKVAFRPA